MPALYRIHEAPDPLKVLQFEEFISRVRLFSLGARRTAASSRSTSRSWSRRFTASPEERPIAFLMLRTMQKARYDADERRPLRPGRAEPTRTSRRRSAAIPIWSCIGCCASCGTTQGRATSGRRSSTRSCRRSAATRRRWSGAPTRPSASSCSGRRSGSWPTRSATSSTATSPASRRSACSSS